MRLVFLLVTFSCVQSHHVLFVHNLGTKSHLITMKPLMEELLERGNKVTSIIFDSVKISHENYTEMVIPNALDDLMKEGSKKLMEKGGTNKMNPYLWWWAINMYKEKTGDMALSLLRTEPVMKLIRERPKIDALVYLAPYNAFFAELFDCPMITFMPAGPISFMMGGTGNVINHSIQPSLTSSFIEPMTFKERIQNWIMISVSKAFLGWQTNLMYSYQKEFFFDEFGIELSHPGDTQIKKQALYLGGSHPITHGAWQYNPSVIEVGGLHLKEAGPLPADLQEFMDSATDGVVLVSFGSSLKPDQMPEEKVQVFIDTFKQLGMKVIWKWDAEMPGLPDNILLSSWLPQQDLLAHPNLKVFVTHGGLGSLVESIYHKARIVGVPLSNDQKPNLLRAERHGYAVSLDWDDITADKLVVSIRKAMEDKEMAASLERIHTLYMDRPERPVDKAAWWVEYVCRHGGADWLKSIGEDVPFYQHHHLDLILALVLVILICTATTFLFWRAVFRCCCRRKTKTE